MPLQNRVSDSIHSSVNRMRGRGFRVAIQRFVKLAFFLLISPFALILRVLGIRFSSGSFNDRIGHLVGEPLYMELRKRNNRFLFNCAILLLPKDRIANSAVVRAFPKKFVVIQSSFWCRLFSVFKSHPLTRVDMNRGVVSMSGPAQIFKFSHLTSALRPFLRVPRRGQREVDQLLANLGIPINGWYVCLHNREAGYSPSDDAVHDYRNASISSFDMAVKFILESGGAVIRMGDSSMQRIPVNSQIIDYAKSDFRSPENDLILTSNCRFFLGNSSGLLLVAAAQGIPCVGVNLAPVGAAKFWGPNDISIPKIYRSTSDDRIVSFIEVFNSKLADLRFTSEFKESGVYLQENSPDEIYEACREMIEQIEGKPASSQDVDLQDRFLALFTRRNYSYFSKTIFSPYFLRKYQNYL